MGPERWVDENRTTKENAAADSCWPKSCTQFQESSIELLILCKDKPCPALGAPSVLLLSLFFVCNADCYALRFLLLGSFLS